MGKSSLMIRMIDIVFILLFGFIAVSQIDSAVSLQPPKSSEAGGGGPDGTRIIVIGVSKDGRFHIQDGKKVLHRLAELRRYLRQEQRSAEQAGLTLGVRVRTDWNTPAKYGLAVVNLCKKLGIPKGLDVIRYTI